MNAIKSDPPGAIPGLFEKPNVLDGGGGFELEAVHPDGVVTLVIVLPAGA